MADNTIFHLKSDVDAAVIASVGSLVSVDNLNGRYRVSLPILMPSGSLIDISVQREGGDTFLVSDDGAAFFDVAGYGVTRAAFTRLASEKADRAGAIFDGDAFFFLRVSHAQLRVAIIAIANLSADVAATVAERSMRGRHDNAREVLFERIGRAFPNASVSRDVTILGASTAPYDFDAMVEVGGRRVVFDVFTKDPVSLNSVYTKLSDVRRLEEHPGLVGVTRDPDTIGPKLTLISSVAKVIPLDASAAIFHRAAA